MVNQSNPYGSLTYSQSGTNPDGTPIYNARRPRWRLLSSNCSIKATPTNRRQER